MADKLDFNSLRIDQRVSLHIESPNTVDTVAGRNGRRAVVLMVLVDWRWIDGDWKVQRVSMSTSDMLKDGGFGVPRDRQVWDWTELPFLATYVRRTRPPMTISTTIVKDDDQ